MTTTAKYAESPGSMLRIHVPRRDIDRGSSLWKRLFAPPLTYRLVDAAIAAGVSSAAVTFGQVGFAKGGKRRVHDLSDVPPDGLPACIELIGSREALDTFLERERQNLTRAVILRFDGVAIELEPSK